VIADPELRPYFDHVALDKRQRMQVEFFSAALDGPIRYTGRTVIHAHQGRRITRLHFQAFVEHLFETLAFYPAQRRRSLRDHRADQYLRRRRARQRRRAGRLTKTDDIRRLREEPATGPEESKAAKVFAARMQQLLQHDRVGTRGWPRNP
jgi:hypothetical protein